MLKLCNQGYLKQMDTNSSQKVVVVTVVYNGEKTLESTITSVLSQTYTNISYIIIDGGSTDNSVNIIRKYEQQLFYWISEKDSGIFNAMNKAVRLIKDPESYVCFINSDDYFCTKRSVAEMIANSDNCDFIYGKVIKTAPGYNYVSGWEMNLRMLAEKHVNHQAVFTKRYVFDKIGLFSERYRINSDHEFIVKVFRDSSLSKRFIPNTVSTMRTGGISHERNFLSIYERLNITREYFPAHIYITQCIQSSTMLPRLCFRLILKKTGLIYLWRIIKSLFQPLPIGGN